jgi:hypothetical protein
MAYGGVEVQFHHSWPRHKMEVKVGFKPLSLYSGEGAPDSYWIGGCGGQEPVWALWTREKSFTPAGIQNP